jgi:hypothetical protein
MYGVVKESKEFSKGSRKTLLFLHERTRKLKVTHCEDPVPATLAFPVITLVAVGIPLTKLAKADWYDASGP